MEGASAALSYRQAGKASKGTLMRGFISGQAKTGGKNFSSIPSKFETTLFTGNKEREGFGSRAHRFVDLENDLPGPGTYADTKLLDSKVYSKKGLGVGFVSKTRRESGFKASSAAPGPGNYERGGSFYDGVRSLNKGNRSGSTATFKPPTQRSVMVASDPVPGPTDYSIARTFDGAAAAGGSGDGVFRSRTDRAGPSSRFVSPAPGQYNPVKPSMAPADTYLPSAAFRSGVPVAGQSRPERLTREQQLGVVPHAAALAPGPGQYEPSATIQDASAHRRMPQFFDSNHDRFGNVVGGAPGAAGRFSVPGPGAYWKEEESKTAVISGSVFMSGTLRGANANRDVVPGPAYYSPAQDAKKSFHLNARSRWVPS